MNLIDVKERRLSLRSKSGTDSGAVRKTRSQRCNETKRLKICKNYLKDPKLFCPQTVVMTRLETSLIKKYDQTFYHRFSKQLRAQKSLVKYSKLRQTLTKSPDKSALNRNESPKRMLLWTQSPNHQNSQTRAQNNYPFLRSHSNHLKQWNKCDESESSLMSTSEYCRYLDLISIKEFRRMEDKQMKTTFSIRNIAKTDDYLLSQDIPPKLVIDPEVVMRNMFDENSEKTLNNNNENKPKSKRSRNEKQKSVGRKGLWTANKVKQKYKNLEKTKRESTDKWKQQYLNCLSVFPLKSPMGQRVYRALTNNTTFERLEVENLVRKYETYCSTRIRFRSKSSELKKYNKWRLNNIEYVCTCLELSHKHHNLSTHEYSFTRRQRLEKDKRLQTRIDWKSRLLAMNCSDKSEVVLKRLNYFQIHKPICLSIDLDDSSDGE